MYEKYEFRTIRQDEADQVARIEGICFPANEACRPEIMKARVQIFPETFLVAVNQDTGKIVGFINGLATNEINLRDDFFTDPALHDPDGSNVMILGVDVLPEYRKQGIAREMMYHYLRREHDKGRRSIVLTCLANKVKMYQKFGFRDCGVSSSSWGGEKWHEMVYVLN
ncbi:MAG: GNAT family N-acetyltransferase [Lachnospiraceae bacterium]|nr:GNAT family N-acetyltransferase [Lachnospiraceae bacterium]